MDKVLIANNEFPTLVALTEEEQSKGLMWIRENPPIMCFPFKNSNEIHRFWMKNTFVPLDIIHCKNNKIVHICRGEPMGTMMLGPNFATDMVVEMPAGSVVKYNVGIGDEVRLLPTLATIARQILG